jgi:hydroxyethylthiazole kinase
LPSSDSTPTAAARRIAPGFLQAKPRPLSAVADYVNGTILPPAVVCEVGWVNGLGAIRSLGRAGVRTVALDHRPWALGFRSRYALPVVAPDPLADQDGFISSLLALAEVLGRPAPIFPTHDEHLNALACRRADLGDRFLYPFPSWDVLEPLQSKRHQLATASRLGIGTPATAHPRSLDEAQMGAIRRAVPCAVAAKKPWVLDPVAVGPLGVRTKFARDLLTQRPTLIRGNASEIIALAGQAGQGRGVDSGDSAEAAINAAKSLAVKTGGAVLVTGEVDYATDGNVVQSCANGHILLTRVTGAGCAQGAMAAACASVADTPLQAALATAALLAIAGDIAAKRATRPGSFQVALLDALDEIDAALLKKHAKLK